MLNPPAVSQLTSPPLSPREPGCYQHFKKDCMRISAKNSINDTQNGKSRSRFSDEEDAIICEGVAKGLTWGQISEQLPHRKRATCFNRYRTLQGARKSRKRSQASIRLSPITPPNTFSWLAITSSSSKYSLQHYSPYLVAPLSTRWSIHTTHHH